MTILRSEEDLRLEVQFGFSGELRERLKAFMRRKGVDFFAKKRERLALIQSIAPAEKWEYCKEVVIC